MLNVGRHHNTIVKDGAYVTAERSGKAWTANDGAIQSCKNCHGVDGPVAGSVAEVSFEGLCGLVTIDELAPGDYMLQSVLGGGGIVRAVAGTTVDFRIPIPEGITGT